MKAKYIVPAIAIPHRMRAEIWVARPVDDPESDGHDLHAILESREEAEAYIRARGHQYSRVAALLNETWPGQPGQTLRGWNVEYVKYGLRVTTRDYGPDGNRYSVYDKAGTWVADCNSKETAIMFAAVPEIAEALERCMTAFEIQGTPNCRAAEEARAALAKAGGK